MKIFRRIWGKFHKVGKDNTGSAIVMVILAIAFVGMLVAMLGYMSYKNFIMKGTDRKAKDNFYTAESALNEINVGLQRDIQTAMNNAYSDVLVQAATLSDAQQKANFSQAFANRMYKTLVEVALDAHGNSTQCANGLKKHLVDYWVETTQAANANDYGAWLELASDTLYYQYDIDKEYIYIYGIKITYKSQDGYVSMINTDLIIKVPDISFAANTEKPDIQRYSLVANENLLAGGGTGTIGSGTTAVGVRISGSVYGGKDGIIASGAGTTVRFKYEDDDNVNSAYTITAGSVNVENRALLTVGEAPNNPDVTGTNARHELWTGNINLFTGNINLDGTTYVKDDLTVDGTDYRGNGSNVVLRGAYYGYGDATASAKDSSAILINGAQSTLDLSGLNELILAGHAYVGATHYNASTWADNDYVENVEDLKDDSKNLVDKNTGYPDNREDIPLGQSVAVKSDQWIYLVPQECMGYDNETGEQVISKNPLTYDEYLKLTTTYIPKYNSNGEIEYEPSGGIAYSTNLKYKVVDLARIFTKMNTSLQAAYGVTAKPIFRKVNGSILVYYYLFFDTEAQANQFFMDYYRTDPETIKKYVNRYVKRFTINPNLGNASVGSYLSLAGNMVYTDNTGELSIKEDTTDADVADWEATVAQRDYWTSAYTGLYHFMMKNSEALTSTQLASDVWTNLIDASNFSSIVGGGSKEFETADGTLKAYAINNRNGSAYEVNSGKYKIIIASGDVVVNVANFKGLIIAGGKISIGGTCLTINQDADKVLSCMMAKNGDKYVYNLFVNGAAYANLTGVAGSTPVDPEEARKQREKDTIRISDLIQYNNWSKE